MALNTYLKSLQTITKTTIDSAATYFQTQKPQQQLTQLVSKYNQYSKTVNIDTLSKSINVGTIHHHLTHNSQHLNQAARKYYTNSRAFQKLAVKLEPVLYYGQVTREIIKQVYITEKLAPPTLAMLAEAQSVACRLVSSVRSLSFKSWSAPDVKRGLVLSGEAVTFFLVGEIVGRRSVIGYSV